jgi:hypothetical protein
VRWVAPDDRAAPDHDPDIDTDDDRGASGGICRRR